MKRNLNERVRVTLTDYGVSILREFYAAHESWAIKPRSVDHVLDSLYPSWKTGYIETHLHDVMHIFGSRLFMGGILPIGTEIEFLDERATAASSPRG